MADRPRTNVLHSGQQATADRFTELVGGPARRNVVVLLACVLALDSADKATIGAVGADLERTLHIGNIDLGLLAAVTSLMGAVGSIPAGMLADRVRRTTLLAGAIAVWSAAMVISAVAVSFLMLLLARLFLGAVVATAGPAVASLTGDYFPGSERGRIYGFILAGELVGAALGFLVSGEVAGALSWRYSFAVLAVPGFVLAWWIWRRLPEPARGGQSRLQLGATEIHPVEEVSSQPPVAEEDADEQRGDELAQQEVESQHVEPRNDLVLSDDPQRMSAWRAVRYVLSVPSNRILILASALGYYFFSGLRTFAVIYLQRHFSVPHGIATALLAVIVVAAIAGALIGGRVADRLISRGRISGRVLVAGIAYIVAAAVFAPGVVISAIGAAIILFIIGAMAVAAPNPPLDAARLDIMPSGLWGRAEGVRTVLRSLAEALAPFLFGYASEHLAARARPEPMGHAASGFGAHASGAGLEYTFLIMLAPLLVSGIIMLRATRTYPRDVATATASEERLGERAAASG